MKQNYSCPETEGDSTSFHLHTLILLFWRAAETAVDSETWIRAPHLLWDNHMVGGLQVTELLQTLVSSLGSAYDNTYPPSQKCHGDFMKETEAENATQWKTYYVWGTLMCLARIIWFISYKKPVFRYHIHTCHIKSIKLKQIKKCRHVYIPSKWMN